MIKQLKYVWFSIRSVFGLGYFAIALAIIFAVAYLLGYGYLQSVKGSDSFFHLSNVFWFSKFFPNIPYWYPLQNGGVVPVWGYPIFSYLLVVIIERLSNLSLVGAYQVLGFLSVPLTALGLYLFVWSRVKNQTLALIAGVFYVLAPISWVWLFDWGFYTESISYIFIFPTLIFYDSYLESYLEGKSSMASRVALVLAITFLAITYLFHPTSFFITAVSASAITFFRAIEVKPRKILLILKRSIIPVLSIVVPTLLLLGFIIFDFYAYASRVPSVPAENDKEVFIDNYSTPPDSLLGLAKIPPTEFKFGHRNIVVPPLIWVPGILGLFASMIYSRKVLALSILAALPVLYFRFPILAWYTVKTIPFSGYVIYHRAILIFLRIFAPVVGAFGVWGLFRILFDLPTFWIKKGFVAKLKGAIRIVITSIFSLALAGYLIFYFANKPEDLWTKTEVRYGPQFFDIRDPFFTTKRQDICAELQLDDPGRPSVCNLHFVRQNIDIEEFISACEQVTSPPPACIQISQATVTETQLNQFIKECGSGSYPDLCRFVKRVGFEQVRDYLKNIDNWPKPNLVDQLEYPLTRFSDFIAKHKNEKFLRIDVSPFLGGVVQTLNLESEISQINLYAAALSLLNPYWGLEQQILFSENTGNTVNVNNMAQWFGIKYLFLEDQLDFIEKYAEDANNWEKVDEVGVWRFKDATELYSWTIEKPTILVVGSKDKAAFEPVFRTSINGAFDYQDGWLVQGKENVDDYTSDELALFDTVLLYGYSYRNQLKAFRVLDEYVSQGGNLFINTGWEFVDADWQLDKAPDFFPVDGLTWTQEYGSQSRYLIEDKNIGGDVNEAAFAPLDWNNLPWGLSIPLNGKKNWANTVLSVEGKPIILAGNYGQGRVIWSGFNLLGHINTYNFNEQEVKFFGNLLRWFGSGNLEEEINQTGKIGVLRTKPDKVEFVFQETTQGLSSLYWRESEFSNWEATLVGIDRKSQNIKIYRAGPGFMFMKLPSLNSGSKLILEFKVGTRTIMGRILSLVTLVWLGLYVFTGRKSLKPFERLFFPITKRAREKVSVIRKSFDNEDF